MKTPKGMFEREKSLSCGRGSGICLMESGLDSREVILVVVAMADGSAVHTV